MRARHTRRGTSITASKNRRDWSRPHGSRQTRPQRDRPRTCPLAMLLHSLLLACLLRLACPPLPLRPRVRISPLRLCPRCWLPRRASAPATPPGRAAVCDPDCAPRSSVECLSSPVSSSCCVPLLCCRCVVVPLSLCRPFLCPAPVPTSPVCSPLSLVAPAQLYGGSLDAQHCAARTRGLLTEQRTVDTTMLPHRMWNEEDPLTNERLSRRWSPCPISLCAPLRRFCLCGFLHASFAGACDSPLAHACCCISPPHSQRHVDPFAGVSAWALVGSRLVSFPPLLTPALGPLSRRVILCRRCSQVV